MVPPRLIISRLATVVGKIVCSEQLVDFMQRVGMLTDNVGRNWQGTL